MGWSRPWAQMRSSRVGSGRAGRAFYNSKPGFSMLRPLPKPTPIFLRPFVGLGEPTALRSPWCSFSFYLTQAPNKNNEKIKRMHGILQAFIEGFGAILSCTGFIWAYMKYQIIWFSYEVTPFDCSRYFHTWLTCIDVHIIDFPLFWEKKSEGLPYLLGKRF